MMMTIMIISIMKLGKCCPTLVNIIKKKDEDNFYVSDILNSDFND